MKAMAKHRTHSIEFKRQVAQDFIAGETLHGLAKRHDISRRSLGLAIGNGSLAWGVRHSAVSTPEKSEPKPDQDNRNANVVSQINSWNGLQRNCDCSRRQSRSEPI